MLACQFHDAGRRRETLGSEMKVMVLLAAMPVGRADSHRVMQGGPYGTINPVGCIMVYSLGKLDLLK